MGLPWPPTWDEGDACPPCDALIFSNRTPIFIYAFAQGIAECPEMPPDVLDPNGVVRMTQQPGFPCWWSGNKVSGIWSYSNDYWFDGFGSHMIILDISGMPVFKGNHVDPCIDHFGNEWNCDDPQLPGFSGGTVDCFW